VHEIVKEEVVASVSLPQPTSEEWRAEGHAKRRRGRLKEVLVSPVSLLQPSSATSEVWRIASVSLPQPRSGEWHEMRRSLGWPAVKFIGRALSQLVVLIQWYPFRARLNALRKIELCGQFAQVATRSTNGPLLRKLDLTNY
jgi:hypothetical protein